MFVTNWISTTKIQKISEITNFFRHYFLSRTEVEGTAYTLIAYSKALRCKVRLVIWQMPNGKKKLFFSTDTSLSGEEVLLYYRTRFQIEFCFQCFVHITKCSQGNYEGDGNGIFYVFIQVTDDQHLSGETNF